LNYLQSNQNTDGGFGYNLESESDGASTAWVVSALNKASINAADWNAEGQNPILFLDSLQQSDGSYRWMPSDEQGSALVTAYALLALLGSSYPVNHISLNEENPIGQSVRIEGPEETICLADNLSGTTVLDVLTAASEVCQFDYTAVDTEYGVYVSEIAGITASGLDGWQFWVNWQAGDQSAATYPVVAGDQILWSFGQFDVVPTDITAILQNDTQLNIKAKYFDGQWHNLTQAEVYVGNDLHLTDEQGEVIVNLNNDGVYPVYVGQSEDYVRSPKQYITIGSGISQSVDLTVNIGDNGNGGGNDQVSFSVSQSNIDFGDLDAGQIAENILQITNTGNLNIYMEASILGDSVFTDHVTLDQATWVDFSEDLAVGASESVNVRLSLPNNLSQSGAKNGQLIFWAIAN
jgi:hypothetical protein